MLRRYLKKHSLNQLIIQSLEIELAAEDTTTDRANQIASELADLYNQQLQRHPDLFPETSRRLDQLDQRFPTATPLETRVEIGFGRFRKARTLFDEWFRKQSDENIRRDVDSRFGNLLQRTNDQISRLRQKLDVSNAQQENNQRIQAAISRFTYLTGWARYYRGIVTDDPDVQLAFLKAAEKDFLELLEVTDTEIVKRLSAQWWTLNSDWTCRLLLGLGMTVQALNKNDDARFVFALLTENRVPDSIENSWGVWRFHSFVFPGQADKGLAFAREKSADSNFEMNPDTWSSVALAGITGPDRKQAPELVRLGLVNLAKSHQFMLIDQIHDQYPGSTVTGDDFFSLWMSGYGSLRNATGPGAGKGKGDGKTAELLVEARRRLEAALAVQDHKFPIHRARCRYHLAHVHFSQNEFLEASELYDQASTLLATPDPDLSQHAAWMQCQCLHRLAASDLQWRGPLSFAIDDFRRRFPDSVHSSQLAFMKLTNRPGDVSDQLIIEDLLRIPKTDENYPQGLFEICRLNHKIWTSVNRDEPEKKVLAGRVIDAAESYLQTTDRQSSFGQLQKKARICLLATDVLLGQDEITQAFTWLQRAKTNMENMPTPSPLQVDFRMMEMTIAWRQNDTRTELESSEWLLSNATQPGQIHRALISRARVLDKQFQASQRQGVVQTQRQINTVIDAYQRLLQHYSAGKQTLDGEDQNYWGNDPVARSALLRLAELETLANNHDEALKCFQTLHQLAPNELVYLQGLARAMQELSRFTDSASHWRVIASGIRVGQPDWIEAKYNLAVCLCRQEPGQIERSLAVIRQTRLLVPDLPSPWVTRFDALEHELSGKNH